MNDSELDFLNCRHKGRALLNDLDGTPAYCSICRIFELEAERDKLKKDIQFMVQKAADKHLPAYREQGEKILQLEIENEKLNKENAGLRSSLVRIINKTF